MVRNSTSNRVHITAGRLRTAAVLVAFASVSFSAHAASREGAFEVDYGQRLGDQKSMIGVIHGADTLTARPGEYSVPPFIDFIGPLDLQIWETGGAMLRKNFIRMVGHTSENARAFLRLNAGDAAPQGCRYKGDPYRPYLDPEMYSTYVSCVAEWARDNGIYALEIWNEPNLTTEFRGDPGQPETAMERWNETYHIAHDAVRSVWPQAIIAGPALATETQTGWLTSFMDYLLANDLTVDVISLHETQYSEHLFPAMAEFIAGVRSRYVDDPLFASVGVKEVIVTESTYKTYNEIPATNLAVWFYFEQGGADAAARTCWNDVEGGKCQDNTLNGLVTLPDASGRHHRTPAWWTTFHYNRTLENRALVTRSHEKLVGVANDKVILFGAYRHVKDPSTRELPVRITLRNVDQIEWLAPNAESMTIRMREIPRLEKNRALDSVASKGKNTFPIQTAADGSKYVEFELSTPAHVVRVFELAP